MEEKYRSKYRISSPRLANWDYGPHGLYFVTICTKDRVRYFGEIEMENEAQGIASLHSSEIGKIAFDNWLQIPQYHPYVEIDEFVIMPDHIHGILFINKPDKIVWESNKFGTQRNNLASIIRGYKASVKKYSTLNGIEFSWQPRYYDRVIREEKEYVNIKDYIFNNPIQWSLNQDNLENLYNPSCELYIFI